mmetsp:Transcript_14307/g.39082  ORF Transcript_14307/g.39082 Transcript_14307/m.39082 type:complete len:248 (+) Transcript_14307:3-746(+)
MKDLSEVIEFILTDQPLHEIFAVISTLVVVLVSCSFFLEKKSAGYWLPPKESAKSKYLCEVWFMTYSIFWVSMMGIIIVFELYLAFDKIHYAVVMIVLSAPLYLQPFLLPSLTGEENVPLLQRYSLKANIWIGIFGFIGNYWYTHYFYNVMKASYTFKSWDINGVPFPMILATHFYFTLYHTLGNMALRKTRSRFAPGRGRFLFECMLVFFMSYVTAFTEAFTISGFPCYSFSDRRMAWVLGSAFYG